MASTYAPIDAFSQSKVFIKMMPLENVQAFILDNALKMMWMAAPWRWTLGNFPVVTLASSQTDYTVTDPADFLTLQPNAAYISAGGDDVGRDVEVVSAIHSAGKRVSAATSQVCHPAANTIRISPKPGATVTSGTQLVALYKKTCPVITKATAHTPGIQVFDDEWFWVYVSAVLYQAYLYADDGRAGNVQFSGGAAPTYSGQRGVFEANIQLMREVEPLLVSQEPPINVGKKGK